MPRSWWAGSKAILTKVIDIFDSFDAAIDVIE